MNRTWWIIIATGIVLFTVVGALYMGGLK